MSQRRSRLSVERGFTLVELLVVIVILSILASLALSGMVAARARGRTAKTRSTIRKLNEVVLPYYESYETRRPAIPAAVEASGNRNLINLVRERALNRLMVMELPDNKNDVNQIFPPPTVLSVSGTSVSLVEVSPVARRYNSLIAGVDVVTSAELLYLIVMRGAAADQDVIAHFRPDEIGDTNTNGLREFVDGWRNPIHFRRWPVGFESPVQSPTGTLVPLIYSAGQDGETGFPESNDSQLDLGYVPTAAQPIVLGAEAKDNIHNHDMTR